MKAFQKAIQILEIKIIVREGEKRKNGIYAFYWRIS
jgi:hypothetical protein